MIRDGRASAMSIMNREKKPLDQSTFLYQLAKWNKRNKKAFQDCQELGPQKCQFTKYEDLVTEPEKWIQRMLSFLNIEFSNKFLNHDKYLKPEFATEKLSGKKHRAWAKIKPDFLNTWSSKIDYNKELVKDTFEMFSVFNYTI
jgi:hypothetical protein